MAIKHQEIEALELQIKKLSLPQMNDFIAFCVNAKAEMEVDARAQLQKQLETTAARLGLDPAAIFGAPAASNGGKVPMKYRNPKDASQAWSGRGREPLWYSALTEAERAQALIHKPVAASIIEAPKAA